MADRIPPPAAGPPLDAAFDPPARHLAQHRSVLARHAEPRPLVVALERERGRMTRHQIGVPPPEHPRFAASLELIERWLKLLVWSRGAHTLHLGAHGPGARTVAGALQKAWSPGGARAFDAGMMARVYGGELAVRIGAPDDLPGGAARELPGDVSGGGAGDSPGGARGDEAGDSLHDATGEIPGGMPGERRGTNAARGRLDGCRIGFDLGASDYKVAALIDGATVFCREYPWNPAVEADPAYHLGHLRAGLRQAAAHLPRVDAIGGSAAGIYVDNRVRVASLFRAVPEPSFAELVEPLFVRLAAEWGVPLRIANDGDVAALCASLALDTGAVLAIAMGSSVAGGYVDRQRRLPGWLNELAFAPVDLSPAAARDEWSGDRGVGASYLSQQAAARLAPAAGIELPRDATLPEALAALQALAQRDDPRARAVFDTIGAYLGQTVPWYRELYDFDTVLLLGRVASGAGGEMLLGAAQATMLEHFPALAERVVLRLPDEATRRVGQAVAAASLPVLGAG